MTIRYEEYEDAKRETSRRVINPDHDYRCGGPRFCVYCRSILVETPGETAERLNLERHARSLRTASEFRAGVQFATSNDDPRIAAIAKKGDLMHYSTCGGPKDCGYCRNLLSETSEARRVRLNAEEREHFLRAGSRGSGETIRTTSAQRDQLGRELQGFGSVQLDPPPDPYADGIAKLRAANAIGRRKD